MDQSELNVVDAVHGNKHEAPETREPLDLGPHHRNKHEAPEPED